MKKTISINLSGQNFLIEEEAYEKLENYLESITRHCGAGADSAEVIADIENSMADKLKSNLTAYKEVINVKDVDALIGIMGTVEDFDREVGNSETTDADETSASGKTKRKLYRDMDNAIIGGVAAGLGAYFDVDPVLFRIAFCALVFAGGSGFLIYILLWIAMPEAKTAHQKLEMQGQMPTLAAFKNLAKTGKQIQENWKKRWKRRSVFGKILSLPLIIINGLFSTIEKIWRAVWPIIRFSFGLFITIFSFIGLGVIGVGSLFLILYNNSAYRLSFIPISEITSAFPYILTISTGFLSLAIPAVLIIIGGVTIMRRKNSLNLATGLILAGIWMAAGIAFCALCLRYYPELRNKFDNYPIIARTEKSVDMSGITEIEANGSRVNVIVSASTTTPATLSGRWIDLENIEMKREKNKLILMEKNYQADNICLDCELRPIMLKIATSSTLRIATAGGASLIDETAVAEEEQEMLLLEIEEATSFEMIDPRIEKSR